MTRKEELLQLVKDKIRSIVPDAKIILFGSRARGEATVDSDWDLLILVNKDKLEPDDFDTISYPIIELGWQQGEHISPKLYTMSDWFKRSFTPFYKNVEEEGVVL